jgi:RecA-family ATPase
MTDPVAVMAMDVRIRDVALAAPGDRWEVFKRACEATARDIVGGWLDRDDAFDRLGDAAVNHDLVDQHGEDAVQRILADAIHTADADSKIFAGVLDPSPPPAPAIELVRLDLARYDTEQIPAREWGVPDRFPRRNVVLLSGHGGIGKSILLLQLAVAHVLGKDWLRSMPELGPVLLVNCEDEGDELARRLQPILDHYRASFAEIDNLHIFPLVELPDTATGQLLAIAGRNGIVQPTPLYAALVERASQVKPICIVIDNVADVFGGSEIDRVQVRQFVGLMRQLARAANGYVILSAHPSVRGLENKSGLSGSTQWHNSTRARAFLRAPADADKSDNDGEGPVGPERVLEFMKSNYSPLAERVELRWAGGHFQPAPTPSAPELAAARSAADALFLKLLDKLTNEGVNLSGNPTANNYAPRRFADTKEAKQAKIGVQSLTDAMSRLIAADRVCVEPYGPPSKSAKRLVRRGLT